MSGEVRAVTAIERLRDRCGVVADFLRSIVSGMRIME